jgi:hypothetical protein
MGVRVTTERPKARKPRPRAAPAATIPAPPAPEPDKPGRLRRLARLVHGPDLLVEIIAVVVGILIALALDEAVDNGRQRRDAAAARQAIRQELAQDMGAVQRRADHQACIDRRLAELGGILNRSQEGADAPSPLWVGRPPIWPGSSAQWDAAVGSGRASLIPADELAQYAGVYDSLELIDGEQQREQHAWARLRALEGQRKAPPEAVQALRVSLAEARDADFRIKRSSIRAVTRAAAMGIRPERAEVPGGVARTASAREVPRGTHTDALRIVQSPFGEP